MFKSLYLLKLLWRERHNNSCRVGGLWVSIYSEVNGLLNIFKQLTCRHEYKIADMSFCFDIANVCNVKKRGPHMQTVWQETD